MNKKNKKIIRRTMDISVLIVLIFDIFLVIFFPHLRDFALLSLLMCVLALLFRQREKKDDT